MIQLPANVRVYVSTAPCDMRKQMDGLAAVVREGLQRDPRGGDMFVFRNRRGDMVKVLFFDSQGYCLLTKRLDKGTFKLSPSPDGAVHISAHEFSQFMRGMSLEKLAA